MNFTNNLEEAEKLDNLNADNYLKFKYILPYEIQDTLKNRKDELKLNEEFDKILKLFLDDYSEEIDEDTDEYFDEIQNCFDHETRLKDIIMEKVFRLIEEDEEDLDEKILKENNINKYTIDFCSCLIQYIKTKIP